MEPKNKEGKGNIVNKNNSNKNPDWVGLSVLIAAVIVGGFFILQQVDSYKAELEALDSEAQVLTEKILFQKRMQNPKNTPQEVYEQARQALLNNDLEGVLETIHPDAMWKYEDNLKSAYSDGNLSELVKPMTPLKDKIIDNKNIVTYSVESILGNDGVNPLERYGEMVEFTIDSKGLWKISSI